MNVYTYTVHIRAASKAEADELLRESFHDDIEYDVTWELDGIEGPTVDG